MEFLEKWLVRPLLGMAALLVAITLFFKLMGFHEQMVQFAWYGAYVVLMAVAVQSVMIIYMKIMDPEVPHHE